jgi:hypothetical protein
MIGMQFQTNKYDISDHFRGFNHHHSIEELTLYKAM